MKANTSNQLTKFTVIFIILEIIFILIGFDKLSYRDSSSSNAYVGGDAYNIIINAIYFGSYLISGLIMELIASIFYCTNVKLKFTPSIDDYNADDYEDEDIENEKDQRS